MIVEIIALNHQGYGIGKINKKVVFVENALEGEIVKIKIVENKKKYCIAKVIEYVKTSLNRVSFPCCFYDKCGGCNIAHMCYEKQLEFKKNKVINILDKYCNLSVNPHINFSNELNYRNKVVFHIKDGKIGFYQNNSNFIVDVDKCLILSDSINKVLKIIRTLDLSLVNNIMIRSTYKDIMLVIEGDINKDILLNNLSFVSSIYINGKLDSYKDNEYFTVKVIGEQMDVVTNYAETHDLDLYDTNKDPGSSNLLYIVVNILPIVIISFLAY